MQNKVSSLEESHDHIVPLAPIYIIFCVQTVAGLHQKSVQIKGAKLSQYSLGECKGMENNRKVFLDFLRIIACFLVIVNHTNSGIFLGATPESKRWFISLAYFFVSKIAVPIFFMISGYLLLNQVESWKKVFRRIVRILVVLIGCAVVYGVYNSVFVNKAGLRALVINIISVYKNTPSTALWYLYAYLGILIMLPYLQKMTQLMDKRDYHIFFAISGAFVGVLPILQHYSGHFSLNPYLYLPLFSGYIWLLFLGQYIARFGIEKTKTGAGIAVALFIAMLGFNIAATYFEYRKSSSNYLFFDNRTFLPIVVEAACVFYLAMFLNFGPRAGRVISWIGSCTFGIYLLSDIIIGILTPYYVKLSAIIHPLIAVLMFELCVFAIGLGLTAVLKKTPLIKKYL